MKFNLKKLADNTKIIVKKIVEDGVLEMLAMTCMILLAVIVGTGGCN